MSWEGRKKGSVGEGGGGGCHSLSPFMKYNGRYGEDPPERDTFPAEVSDISKGREFTTKIV